MPHSHAAGVSSGRPVTIVLGRVLGALLSAALVVASGYFWLSYRDIDNNLTRLGGVRVGEAQQGTAEEPVDRRDQNILVVGNDDRSNLTRAEQEDLHVGPGQGSKATDTMLIVHIPADGSRATLLSLPRDSYVDIPGQGMGRLNSAFVLAYNEAGGNEQDKVTAGANALIETIGNLTGLTIHRYVQIGLLGFYRIANALDGVPVTLCAPVDDPKSGFKAKKGRTVLDGKEALQFVRQRYNFPDGRGDLDRVKRQQYFLTAAFRKVASAGILLRLNELGDALRTSLYLDPGFDTLNLARQVQGLTADRIKGATIPNEPATIDGQDVLRVDPERVQRYVSRLLDPPAGANTSPAPASTAPATVPSTTPSTAPSADPSASPSGSPSQAIDSRCIY